jgi:hypothetical protein
VPEQGKAREVRGGHERVRPVSPDTGALERHLEGDGASKDATVAEYLDADGKTHLYLFRWRPSVIDRQKLARGDDIYVMMVGFTVPHKVEIGEQPWMRT